MINTDKINLITDLDLNFNTTEKKLYGDIDVLSGHLDLDTIANSINKTRDIVYSDSKFIPNDNPIKYDLNVNILNFITAKGIGITAKVNGGVNITYLDQYTRASGNLKVIEGTFKLKNHTFDIKQGSFIYNPNTIITDPLVDLFLVTQKISKDKTDQGLHMKGLLSNPEFELFGYTSNSESLHGDAYNLLPIIISTKEGNAFEVFSKAAKIDHINIESDEKNERYEDV